MQCNFWRCFRVFTTKIFVVDFLIAAANNPIIERQQHELSKEDEERMGINKPVKALGWSLTGPDCYNRRGRNTWSRTSNTAFCTSRYWKFGKLRWSKVTPGFWATLSHVFDHPKRFNRCLFNASTRTYLGKRTFRYEPWRRSFMVPSRF